jgi:hypothetical protein
LADAWPASTTWPLPAATRWTDPGIGKSDMRCNCVMIGEIVKLSRDQNSLERALLINTGRPDSCKVVLSGLSSPDPIYRYRALPISRQSWSR